MIVILSMMATFLSSMLVGRSVNEFNFHGELTPFLFFSEDIECVFFGDVPLDGGVGAGGAYGFDLSFGGVEETVLTSGFF